MTAEQAAVEDRRSAGQANHQQHDEQPHRSHGYDDSAATDSASPCAPASEIEPRIRLDST
jgi:hypothetical protein